MTRLGDAKLSGKSQRDFAILIGATGQQATKAIMFATADGCGDVCKGMSRKETDMPSKPPEKLFGGLSDSQLGDIARDAHYNVGPTLQHIDALIASHRALRANHAAEKEKVRSELARDLWFRYQSIFTISSTGERNHPVHGGIDYEAKAGFEALLEAARTADIRGK